MKIASLLFAFSIISRVEAFIHSIPTRSSLVDPITNKSFHTSPQKSTCLKAQEDGDDFDFMKALNSRIQQVQELETKIPLVVLDCMLPRQTLKIKVRNPLLMELVREQMQKETPTFGMLGMAILNTGEKINLTTGCEVEIIEKPVFEGDSVFLVLKASRRFIITGEVDNAEQGWTEARVKYLDSQEQEDEEIENSDDKMSVARAIMKAKELTTPNANMENNLSLVDRWIELAKQNEREGQIDALLEDIGRIPPEDQPTERALWIGA